MSPKHVSKDGKLSRKIKDSTKSQPTMNACLERPFFDPDRSSCVENIPKNLDASNNVLGQPSYVFVNPLIVQGDLYKTYNILNHNNTPRHLRQVPNQVETEIPENFEREPEVAPDSSVKAVSIQGSPVYQDNSKGEPTLTYQPDATIPAVRGDFSREEIITMSGGWSSTQSLIPYDPECDQNFDNFTEEVGATGLTMKEYDDQLKKLTSDNFQLKLKIFFMDERFSKLEGVHDKDILIENVKLKVENEMKAKELERLSKLISDSAKAIEQLQRERMISGAEGECFSLSCKNELCELRSKLQESEIKIQELEKERTKWREKVQNLESDAEKAKKIADELASLKTQVEEWKRLEEKTAEGSAKITELEGVLSTRNRELSELKETHEKACGTIHAFVRRSVAENNEKQKLMDELAAARKALKELRSQGQQEGNFQTEFKEEDNDTKKDRCVLGALNHTKSRLEAEVKDRRNGESLYLDDKEAEVAMLRNDLKAQTANLQELVSRQIQGKNDRVKQLEDQLCRSEAQLKAIMSEKTVLAKEVEKMKENQGPLTEACLVLTERLRELAGFLDSMLTDRLALSLDGSQHNALRQALHRTREISQRFSLSCCTDKIHSFSDTLLREHINRLSLQPLYENNESVHNAERRESEPLSVNAQEGDTSWLSLDIHDASFEDFELSDLRRGEIQDQRPRLRRDKHSPRLKLELDNSESEAWSEPDRAVSLARMGTIDPSITTPLRLSKGATSCSSEETLNESKPSVKRSNSDSRRVQSKVKTLEDENRNLRVQLFLLEKKHSILGKLSGETGPELVTEIQQCLSELESVRENCLRLKEELSQREKLCEEHLRIISNLEAKSDELALDYELKLIEAVQEKDAAEQKVSDLRNTLNEAEDLRLNLEKQVAEISSRFHVSQVFENKTKEQMQEAERHLNSCEQLLQDKAESDRKIRELEQMVCALKEEAKSWATRAQHQHEEMTEVRRQLNETLKSKAIVEAKVREEGERIAWMDAKLKELEQAMEQCEKETQAKIVIEAERRVEIRVTELKKEWVPRLEFEQTRRSLEEAEGMLLTTQIKLKEQEAISKRLSLIEQEKRETSKLVNVLRVRESELEKELSRLASDRMRLEREYTQMAKQKSLYEEECTKVTNQKAQLEEEMTHLTNQKLQLEDTIRRLERQNDEMRSVCGRNLSSPDLGIESDQGRFSSLENHQPDDLIGRCHSCESLRLRLEDTLAELASANQHKKQMERAICRQLHKTHHILKKARVNFESHDSDE